MSDRDVLDDALDALREEKQGADTSRAAATRRAIMLAAMTRQRRRSLAIRYVLPLAAALAAGTAWAAATGRLPQFFAPSPVPAPTAPSVPPSPLAASPSALPAALAPPPPPPPPPSPSPSLSLSLSPSPSPSSYHSPPPPASSTSAARPLDREDTLYRSAHEAHFVSREPARALAAWDAYLASYPSGRFAPEARYNRALALIRLGRSADARAALLPFAEAGRGGYRQAEARALLDAME